MDRLKWKKCSAGFGISVGLTAALIACSSSTSPLGSDSGPPDSATTDANGKTDAPANDGAIKDSSSDSTATDSATDAGSSDAPAPPPPPLHLCDTLDSFWGLAETGDAAARTNQTSWPAEILNGIPGTGGIAGYLNVIDCRVDGIFAEGPVNTDAGPEFNIWQNAAQEFEYQFFGCAGDGGAGVGFALVPPILYGMPMGQADLKLLGDWYVTSLIQAVANQSESNAQAVLTGPQIDAIEAEMAYQETLYPDIVPTSGYLYSTCPSDAGADGSGD